MADGEPAGGVQGDLERELTCSICTDLLYQPLTLLDCLHTFCGACLKEWFVFQASTATSLHPYTCPSCRASVRSTQPNATVTTLLDIFLKANPSRGKSEAEKRADREKYRPGDNVLPKLRRRDDRDEQDQRVLEEVQQLSLREAGITDRESGGRGGSASLEPPRERRRRERSQNGSRDSRTSRTERRSVSRHTQEDSSPTRAVVPPRSIEHQSSLRSLLSASELDSNNIDEDLVHQVLEALTSEGMDLNQIGIAEEEEITERIAEAVRQRQAERHAARQRERRERRDRLAREGLTSTSIPLTEPLRSPAQRDDDNARRRLHARTASGTSTSPSPSGPPISRPGLIDSANRRGQTHHTRSSSQGSSMSVRRAERPSLSISSAAPRQESDRPSTSDAVPANRRRQSDNQPSGRLEARQQSRNSPQPSTSSQPSSPLVPVFTIPTSNSPTSSLGVVGAPSLPLSSSTPAVPPSQPPSLRRTTDPARARQTSSSHSGTPPLVVGPILAPMLYTEPMVSCKHCGKEHIEYELHYNCARCEGGAYDICMRCYRQGKGCKNWFGFGWTAWRRYAQQAPEGGYPPSQEEPHVLVGARYQRPSTPLTESPTPPHVLRSAENPEERLESGVFCDTCKAFANACYWKCDYCNDGDWGFCNDCVNQGRHCTHPLVPVARKVQQTAGQTDSTPSAPSTPRQDSGLAPPDRDTTPTTPPLTPKSASLLHGPGYFTIANSVFRPLTFTTLCNVCRHPIPPSNTRYHCLRCNAGDYDICTSCYHKLVASSRIPKEDGSHGWRKCLRNHRMVIVGFEDRDGGQRRIVVAHLVGGHALAHQDQYHARPQRYPPDGGFGLRLLARWAYWPDPGDDDELGFPRGAEIREAANVNGDWYWGVYSGAKGLFPAAYVTTL